MFKLSNAILKYFSSVFKKHVYAFACLQETRGAKNQIRLIDDVVVCSSAGTDVI
jgi:hypothetical protein